MKGWENVDESGGSKSDDCNAETTEIKVKWPNDLLKTTTTMTNSGEWQPRVIERGWEEQRFI